MVGAWGVDISVMVVWEYHWCCHARFLGHQQLCHVSMVLQYIFHVSVELNVSVMLDWESQWCYYATFLGSHYVWHGGQGPSGAPIIDSYRDPMHIDKPFHFNEDFSNWYNCTHIYFFLDNEEMFSG